MNARDELIEIVTRDPRSSGGDEVWATDLVDAHRAEVLREEVRRLRRMEREMPQGALGTRTGVLRAALVLDEQADLAGEKSSRKADATPQPASAADRAADWHSHLRAAAHDWPGEWTTKRVQHLYLARYGLGRFRGDARLDLEQLHREGLLVLNDQEPGRRFYTFNTRKDATS